MSSTTHTHAPCLRCGKPAAYRLDDGTGQRNEPYCSIECLLKGPKGEKRAKYGNHKIVDDLLGRSFDSKHEARVARWLWARQEAGEVRNLAFQTRYPIEVNDEVVCVYVADFVYDERCPERDTSMGQAWVERVADAKSPPTRKNPVYRIKKKLMAAVHGITIVEL